MGEDQSLELHSLVRVLHNSALIEAETQRKLKDSNIRLNPDHEPNPERTYAEGVANMIFRLNKKYDPVKVEEAVRRYCGFEIEEF